MASVNKVIIIGNLGADQDIIGCFKNSIRNIIVFFKGKQLNGSICG